MHRIVSGIISNIAYLNDCVGTIWHNSNCSKAYNLRTYIISHRDTSLVGLLIFTPVLCPIGGHLIASSVIQPSHLYYFPSGHLVGGLKTRNSTRNLT